MIIDGNWLTEWLFELDAAIGRHYNCECIQGARLAGSVPTPEPLCLTCGGTGKKPMFDENYVNDWAGMSTFAGRAWHAWAESVGWPWATRSNHYKETL